MQKSLVDKIFCFGLVFCSFNVLAVTDADIVALKGQEIIYSSPFEAGNKAIKLKSDSIRLSSDFIDDGKIIIQQTAYPIDQLFVQNTTGQYENLASLLNYDGVAKTYFFRYYDSERLALYDELKKLKHQTVDCVGNYTGGGSDAVAKETEQFSTCLDNVFYRIVNLFYAQSSAQMIEEYKEQNVLWEKLYFTAANPDNCYGQCGTVAHMRAYGKIVDAKQKFILDLLDDPILLSE